MTGNLVDYFVVCGLDVDAGLEPNELSGEQLHSPPLYRPYKSSVLQYFPQHKLDQDAVNMLCFPHGLSFSTQLSRHTVDLKSFIITRQDGQKTYGTSLTFFEEVSNDLILTAMEVLHQMHVAETKNNQSKTLYSHLSAEPVISQSPEIKKKQRDLSLQQMYRRATDKLYVSKCLCFLSTYPFVSCLQKSLYKIYSSILHRSTPIEALIYYMLYCVPQPTSGASLQFNLSDLPLVLYQPDELELPQMDYSLAEFFQLLGVGNVLLIFTCALLESQILICSKDYNRLMLVAECVTCLLFPFQWQHVYVPIIPASLTYFLEAPVPFIMGYRCASDDRSQFKQLNEGNLCFVDIDTCQIEVPEDLPNFPSHMQLVEELMPLLEKYNLFSYDEDLDEDDDEITPDESTSDDLSGASSQSSLVSKVEILQQSEAFVKITSLVKKSRVISSITDLADKLGDHVKGKQLVRLEEATDTNLVKEITKLKFNAAVREIFFNRFLDMFYDYESFVIYPDDLEFWLSSQDTSHIFDKVSFLSEQLEANLPFLSAFLETQMFTSFIMSTILSRFEEPDLSVRVMDNALQKVERRSKDDPGYHMCQTVESVQKKVESKFTNIDITIPAAQENQPSSLSMPRRGSFSFPKLQSKMLKPMVGNQSPAKNAVISKIEKYIKQARRKHEQQPVITEASSQSVARTNIRFVESLLRESKNKTKRLLVEKMGEEGIGEVSITGVEENTLIVSLCDLLERIWNHGLQKKEGKSALWTHLLFFKESQTHAIPADRLVNNNSDDPASSSFTWCTLRKQFNKIIPKPDLISSLSLEAGQDKKGQPSFESLPSSLLFDMKNILRLTDIKTEVGCARAFVRLSLERKLLGNHMRELLSDRDLVKSLYKRYAFLRCEDEKEQFIYHLLSLNVVDYMCFTKCFTKTTLRYRVLIFPSRKLIGAITTSNPWLIVTGQHCSTSKLKLPRGTLDFTFSHMNLGMLVSLRIGHDCSGLQPNWLVENVFVRNEVTGHCYRFPCGRWLGRNVDDGSTERLLVAQLVSHKITQSDLVTTCATPPRSPVLHRRASEQKLRISDVQELLGNAVNALVKYYEKERGSLVLLLCGEDGIVVAMQQVFACGFRQSRFKRFYVWDFLQNVTACLSAVISDKRRKMSERTRNTCRSLCYVMGEIERAESVGKDEKFQIWICIGLRDNLLCQWVSLIAMCPVTPTMYDQRSFLRDKELLRFVVYILDSLKNYPISIDQSITKGINV